MPSCQTVLLVMEDEMVEEIQRGIWAALGHSINVVAIPPGHLAFDYMTKKKVHLVFYNFYLFTLPIVQGTPAFLIASKTLYPKLPIVSYVYGEIKFVDIYSERVKQFESWAIDAVVHVNNVDELISEARKLVNTGENTEAINAQIGNDNIDALSNLFLSYALLSRRKEAAKIFKKIIEIGQNKAEAYFNFGNYCSRKGMYKMAVDAFKKGMEIEPDNSESYYMYGLIHRFAGRFQEAIVAYQQAIQLSPNSYTYHFLLAESYAKLSLHREAIEALKRAIEILPRMAEAHFELGNCYSKIGQKISALDEYQILQRLNPVLAEALFDKIYK